MLSESQNVLFLTETFMRNSFGNKINNHGSKMVKYVNINNHKRKRKETDVLCDHFDNMVKLVLKLINLTGFMDIITMSKNDAHAIIQGTYLIYVLMNTSFTILKQGV